MCVILYLLCENLFLSSIMIIWVVEIVEPSVVNIWWPCWSCPIGIRLRLVKVTNVSLEKQPEDDDDDDDDGEFSVNDNDTDTESTITQFIRIG